MEFEWDPDKARINLAKHAVSFEDASRVFGDPNRIESFDYHELHGEDRWETTGRSNRAVVTVIYTIRRTYLGEKIRIISARQADRDEETRYGEIYGRSE